MVRKLGVFVLFYALQNTGAAELAGVPSPSQIPDPNKSSFVFEHTHYNELRKRETNQRVFYDVETFFFKHVYRPQALTSQVNFSVKRDLLRFTENPRDFDRFYLYSANVQKKDLFKNVDLTIGRMVASRLTRLTLFDGAEVMIRDPRISALIWAGGDRSLDLDAFDDFLYSFGSTIYAPRFWNLDTFGSYRLSSSKDPEGWEDWGHFIAAGAEWGGPFENRLYARGVVELEASDQEFESSQGELTYLLADSTRLRGYTAFFKRDSLKGRFEESLMSVFGQNSVWESSFGFSQLFTKFHEVTPTYSFSFDDIAGRPDEQLSHKFDLTYRGALQSQWLSFLGGYRYMTSSGGTYHLIRGEATQSYRRFFSLAEKVYWANYDKITSARNNMLYYSLSFIVNSVNRWNVILELGNSSSSLLTYDFVGRLAIQYRFWR